jgi:hypothetical protein
MFAKDLVHPGDPVAEIPRCKNRDLGRLGQVALGVFGDPPDIGGRHINATTQVPQPEVVIFQALYCSSSFDSVVELRHFVKAHEGDPVHLLHCESDTHVSRVIGDAVVLRTLCAACLDSTANPTSRQGHRFSALSNV